MLSPMNSEMLDQTLVLLSKTRLSVEVIADAVGVSRRWLYDLRSGGMKDPGVRKVEAVYKFLRDQDQQAA